LRYRGGSGNNQLFVGGERDEGGGSWALIIGYDFGWVEYFSTLAPSMEADVLSEKYFHKRDYFMVLLMVF
jgi:hypothetical protein